MGTEVCSSIGSLLSELENAKRGLQKIDENIKKVVQTTGRFQNDRNFDRNFQNSSNENARGGPRFNRGNFYNTDNSNNRNFEDDRQGRKRPQQETKTVFSRLSARPNDDSDGEEDIGSSKRPRISSQVIRELPTKQEVLKAQTGDEVSKARNRRMFGSLLGTLQKFKQEEIVLKNKEEKKAQVEKKIEEQAKQEKENQKRERQNLFAEREIKKATIKALEAKMIRMQSYEVWEKNQKPLVKYIQTKWKPHIYWLPKRMNSQTGEKLEMSQKRQEKIIEDKQKELKDELEDIEQRCLRSVKLPPGVRNRPTSLSQSTDMDQSLDHHDETMEMDDEQLDDSVHCSSEPAIKQEDEENRKKTERLTMEKSQRFSAIKNEKNKDSNDDEESLDDSSDEEKNPNDNSGDSDNDKNQPEEEEPLKCTPKIEVNGSYSDKKDEINITNSSILQEQETSEDK